MTKVCPNSNLHNKDTHTIQYRLIQRIVRPNLYIIINFIREYRITQKYKYIFCMQNKGILSYRQGVGVAVGGIGLGILMPFDMVESQENHCNGGPKLNSNRTQS